MTRITFERQRLIAEGHAGYGPKGQDIVCAGISCLMQTAAQCLLEDGNARKISIKPGKVVLAWEGQAPWLRFVRTGVSMLQEAYPDNILVQE